MSIYQDEVITVSSGSDVCRVTRDGAADTIQTGEITAMLQASRDTLWAGQGGALLMRDFRSARGVNYDAFGLDSIYRISRVDERRLLVACSEAENVVALIDSRNPLRPLQTYTCHGAYITKFFALPDFYYSADEDGNVYKLSYDSGNILNRMKFNQNQSLIDLDYSFHKDYFIVLLENNIIKQTEYLVFDDIRNTQSPYHKILFSKNGTRTVFANNSEVIFCDEFCTDHGEYVKEADSDCHIQAFREGVLFTDGPKLLYNALRFADIPAPCEPAVRCQEASVTFDDQTNEIGKGLCILVGIREDDMELDADYIIGKILNMRLWDDGAGKTWSQSVSDIDGEILLISQFTLYGFLKGNKPDFHYSMGNVESRKMYDAMLAKLQKQWPKTKGGFFGEYMTVNIENDGPVTILLDSREEKRLEGAEGMAKIGGPKAVKIQERLDAQKRKEEEEAAMESQVTQTEDWEK